MTERPSQTILIQEVENYTNKQYPVRSEDVEKVLEMLRNYEHPGFPGRKDITEAFWADKASEMADKGYDFKHIENIRPENDLPTLVNALAKFGFEIHKTTDPDIRLSTEIWKVRMLCKAEFANAAVYIGMIGDMVQASNHMQKANDLFEFYKELNESL